jgi:hypothetical protein
MKHEKEEQLMTTNPATKPADMTDVIELYIKPVIDAYPTVGKVLAEAGIGCVTCSVGTCLIKDVVSIHNLTEASAWVSTPPRARPFPMSLSSSASMPTNFTTPRRRTFSLNTLMPARTSCP